MLKSPSCWSELMGPRLLFCGALLEGGAQGPPFFRPGLFPCRRKCRVPSGAARDRKTRGAKSRCTLLKKAELAATGPKTGAEEFAEITTLDLPDTQDCPTPEPAGRSGRQAGAAKYQPDDAASGPIREA